MQIYNNSTFILADALRKRRQQLAHLIDVPVILWSTLR